MTMHQRFAAQIQFLKDRLSPEGYLGLHLTVGALLLIVAAWLFGIIAEDVATGEPLTLVDQAVAAWFHERATPGLTQVMLIISFFGSVAWTSAVSFAIALYLLWKRLWYALLILVLTVPGGMLLNVLLKAMFHRDRPVFEHPIVTLESYSFPSGHTMAATVLYGTLAVLAASKLKAWRWKILILLAALLVMAAIGLSRIYLGAHYLSDVLAAMAEGLVWLALCVTAVDTLRRRRLAGQGSSFRELSKS